MLPLKSWRSVLSVLVVLALGGAVGAGLSLAQNAGTQRLFPPADDPSLVNHQPWTCSQLTANCVYNTIAANGLDQTTQIQTALNNCGSSSGTSNSFVYVRLGPGIFITSSELLVPPNCVFVAEAGLDYTPYISSTAGTVIQPGFNFVGTAVVAFNGNMSGQGHFGMIKGINVDGQYRNLIDFQGYIVGTVLHVVSINSNTLSPGLVAWMDIRDTTGTNGLASPTKVVNQLSGTTGGVGTYTIEPSQTVGSVGTPVRLGGVIHCFEHLANASFTTVEDLQAIRCTGDGYNVTADGSQSGGQGGSGLIRPIMHGGLLQLNMGSGVRVTEVNSSAATDMMIDRGLNAASNGNNTFNGQVNGDVELSFTEGQVSDLRTEQDGSCGLYVNGSTSLFVTNFFSDTNRGGAACLVGGAGVTFVNGGTFTRDSGTGKAGVTLSGSSSATFLGFAVDTGGIVPHDSWQYTIKTDASSSANGWFPVASPIYFNATTQNNVQPNLLITNTALSGLPPTINLISQGGTAFTAGWPTVHTTITGGQTDPLSGTNAAKIVEDATSNTHSASQAVIVPDNGTYNCSVYYKALGVGSARGLNLSLAGSTGSAFTLFDSSGNTIGGGTSGTAAQIGTFGGSSNTNAGNGWIQAITTMKTLGAGVGSVNVGLNSGGSGTYLGDGTSGQFIYGPICVVGTVAP